MLSTKGAVKRAERPCIRRKELTEKPTLAWVRDQMRVYELPRANHQPRLSAERTRRMRDFMRYVFAEVEPAGPIPSVISQTPTREPNPTPEVTLERVPHRLKTARARGAAKRWWAPSGFGVGASKQVRLR
jgi:hypothetical protein